jgi:hypothetical protein
MTPTGWIFCRHWRMPTTPMGRLAHGSSTDAGHLPHLGVERDGDHSWRPCLRMRHRGPVLCRRRLLSFPSDARLAADRKFTCDAVYTLTPSGAGGELLLMGGDSRGAASQRATPRPPGRLRLLFQIGIPRKTCAHHDESLVGKSAGARAPDTSAHEPMPSRRGSAVHRELRVRLKSIIADKPFCVRE